MNKIIACIAIATAVALATGPDLSKKECQEAANGNWSFFSNNAIQKLQTASCKELLETFEIIDFQAYRVYDGAMGCTEKQQEAIMERLEAWKNAVKEETEKKCPQKTKGGN